MNTGLSYAWVRVNADGEVGERAGVGGPGTASVFAGDPRALETLPVGTRRAAQAALQRCLELLVPVVGESLDDVDLLLVFAEAFATAWARRLVTAVEANRRVRPTDSTNMETSESVRAALAALDRGRPRSALVVASAFDPGIVASLCAGCRSVLVVRIELHGAEPEDCDVWAAHVRPDLGGGSES